jgi:hypothetical protein
MRRVSSKCVPLDACMPASPLCCLQIFDVSVYKKSLPASVRTYPDKSRRINTLQACTLKNGLNRMHLTPRMMLVVLLEAHRCDYGSRCVGEIKRMDVITRGYIRTGYAQTSEDQDKETCMSKRKHTIMAFSALAVLLLPGAAIAKHGSKVQKSSERAEEANAVLWRNPDDIKSRNLFYGPGGEKDMPHTTYTFEKEDLDGTSPKFIVRDEIGVRWRVKMGREARSETVASRLVWAVGYSTNEDYFLPELHVEGMPEHLRRGQRYINPPGTAHNVRLKRYLESEKKVGLWRWSDNPFTSTRELNGLRVMMALINNWDSKDINNSLYYEKHPEGLGGPENIYMVSDLGASFGTTGVSWKRAATDGNLHSFSRSKFMQKASAAYVDLPYPHAPSCSISSTHPITSCEYTCAGSAGTFPARTSGG